MYRVKKSTSFETARLIRKHESELSRPQNYTYYSCKCIAKTVFNFDPFKSILPILQFYKDGVVP